MSGVRLCHGDWEERAVQISAGDCSNTLEDGLCSSAASAGVGAASYTGRRWCAAPAVEGMESHSSGTALAGGTVATSSVATSSVATSALAPVLSSDSSDWSDSSSEAEPEPEVCHVHVLDDMWDNIARRLTHTEACAVMCTCTELLVQVSMSRVACCAPQATPHGQGDRQPIHAHMDMLEALGRAAYRGLASGCEACAVSIVASQLAPDVAHMHRVAARVLRWCMHPPSLLSVLVLSHVRCVREQSRGRVRVAACAWVCNSEHVWRMATERDTYEREQMERAVAALASELA